MSEGYNLVAALVVVVGLIWAFSRFGSTRRPIRRALPPERDEPYSVFTTEFDVICRGRDLMRILHARGASGWPSTGVVQASLEERTAIAGEAHANCLIDPALGDAWPSGPPGQNAIAILVDQSGSMANRMPRRAGELRAVIDRLGDAGIPTAVAGFTTCGWRGGQSREKWRANGKPAYPGRLCDLLHIVYKDFDDPVDEADWGAMLHADTLFENVDGEALEWGDAWLAGRSEPKKFLIVISDGAPVDDSTLSENGASFLERHILATIEEIMRSETVRLGAIGIDHEVDRYYPNSEVVDDTATLASAFSRLTDKLRAPSGSENGAAKKPE